VSRILLPSRDLILSRRYRQLQGGFIMTPHLLAGNSAAHRYWRVYITANAGDATYVGFTEIELRSTVGGADFTVPQTLDTDAAKASAQVNNSNGSRRAVDNSDTTGWLTITAGGGLPAWWEYDCGNAGHSGNPTEVVRQILIKGSWNVPAASPKDFLLQWSDDNTSWTTVMTVTGQTGWTGASDARTFNVP